MSSLKARMAMFQTGAAPLTPEAQARKLREAKEREDQAVRIARARTARYNMTLRSLALKQVRETSDQKRKEFEAVKAAQDRASRYNMTSRALAMVAGKNQRNVARAFDPDVSPDVAKKMIKAVATHQMASAKAMLDPSSSEKARLSAASAALDVPDLDDEDDDGAAGAGGAPRVRPEKMNGHRTSSTGPVKPMAAFATAVAGAAKDKQQPAEPEQAQETAEEAAEEAAEETAEAEEEEQQEAAQQQDQDQDEDAGDGDEAFVMDDLARAVAQGDEEGVNRAVLTDFLREHAPHRLHEVDALLEQYAGEKVDVLFEQLVDEYPDPAEALDAGKAKALADAKRASAAAASGGAAAAAAAAEAAEAEAEDEDGGDEDEDGDEHLSAVEQARREAAAAERAEKDKIARMSPEERDAYFAEKEADERHRQEKDAMLKAQLGMYAKGGAKGNPVLAAARRVSATKAGEAKRVSQKLDKAAASPKGKKPSVVGDGFILSGAKARDSASRERPGSTRQSQGGSKWAVNVQPQLLRERMKKAGVADADIDELMAEESDML